MKINYQVIDFNYKKIIEVIDYFSGTGPFHSVIIGDFSCLQRNSLRLKKNPDFIRMAKVLNKKNIRLFLQLPLITKEDELEEIKSLIKSNYSDFDGFITGDLGVVSIIDKIIKKNKKKKDLHYTTNVLNRTFSGYLKEKFDIDMIRPLMFKRVFIEEDIGFDKDIVIYGNMMLNCSTFCFHSGDLVTKCNFSCRESKEIIMRKELIHLVGRSFITEKRLDLLARIDRIKNIRSATIMDYNLRLEEIKNAAEKINKIEVIR